MRVQKVPGVMDGFANEVTTKNRMDSDITRDGRSFAATEVAEHLRRIENRLATAWVEGDRSFIEQILAEDWSVIDLTGRILKKAEVLEEAFGSKDRQIVSMHIDDLSVR